ncbi:DUF1538 domain-containing protein [Aliikangiella maris]|uniref:DUF1538 domain-containing protein n=2 Tax=Aliikangiella maris TaxID=3162458 RepID=A0ABV3MR69_9GAMM
MNWSAEFFSTLLNICRDILPITLVIFGFRLFIIRKKIKHLKQVINGFILVIIGLVLFILGLEKALFPIGKLMATQLSNNTSSDLWIYLFGFLIGASTTIAEPALIAVALKANRVSGGAISFWGLRVSVAIGVAIGITLGIWRIITGYPIHWFITIGYAIVIVQTLRAPKLIIPLAFDSGGVTTSTVTVPLITALGLGLADAIPGRNPLIDGFGLIAFASLFPIISVMAYAQISEYKVKQKLRSRYYQELKLQRKKLIHPKK